MHPDEGFIDQSPEALQLTVVEGNLDRSQFTLLAGDAFVLRGVRIEATVIGASHVISFDAGPFVLHEVFACVDVPGIPSWTLRQLLSCPVERQLPGMHYEFQARLIPTPEGEPDELRWLTRLAQMPASGIGVRQEFPRGSLGATPVTIIVIEGDEVRGATIDTAHFYPGRALVLSRSSLRFTKEDHLS